MAFVFSLTGSQRKQWPWSEFTNEGKAIAEQILVPEEIIKSKRARLWESNSGIQVGKLTIWVRSLEKEKLQQSSPGQKHK